MKEIVLSSGASLKIGEVPFDLSNNLKKVVLREIKGVSVTSSKQVIELYKDFLCTAFSSDDVEKCLWECFARCMYNGLKIDKSTFESMEARADYCDVQMEVAQECLLPFGKALWSVLQRMLATAGADTQK